MNDQPSPLDRLIRFCIEQKFVVVLFTALAVAWGVLVAPFDWTLAGLPRDPVPVDAIPDTGENQQIVFTEWAGRSPQDIDDQVSYPLTVALLGIPGVKSIRSQSILGFSMVYVIFDDDVDFYWSRTRILEKLNSLPAGTLPPDVAPALGPDATALGQVFWYTLEGRDRDGNPTGGWDLHELRSVQDWIVRYALMSADGVAEVASVGGFVQEYQIDVDPDAMRAHDVTLQQVFSAVRDGNVDVGARTIEVNKVEYVVRGLGFIESLADIEHIAVDARRDVPVYIEDVAHVALGPALRRGALDNAGAEAVGGVVVVRFGENPLRVIGNVKAKIEAISPGLPGKILPDGTESRVTIVPFYDRTGLIYETLDTLNAALEAEVLVTIIVVVLMVMHLRSSILISGMLPLAVLMTFIGMKLVRVDANIVALSGIAIAVGTIVDMGIVMCENILKRLNEAGPDESKLEVICRAATEVGSAILTAVLTTVVSFLPVFTLESSAGKLFRPLAYTKTFALIASVIIALTIIPPLAHVLFTWRINPRRLRQSAGAVLAVAGAIVAVKMHPLGGLLIAAFGAFYLLRPWLPAVVGRALQWSANIVAVAVVLSVLAAYWEPLGSERGFAGNAVFVGVLIGGLLLVFYLFMLAYPWLLRWSLRNKLAVLLLPLVLIIAGLTAGLGPGAVLGPSNKAPDVASAGGEDVERKLVESGVFEHRGQDLVWSAAALGSDAEGVAQMLRGAGVGEPEEYLGDWEFARDLFTLRNASWEGKDRIADEPLETKLKWTLARSWDGLARDFMPELDEGSFLLMPTTMPHASIGEALDALQKMDKAINAVPEVTQVVGKIGRAETPLDPAPVSMVETIIHYRPEYLLDEDGRRARFRWDASAGRHARDERGLLIPDPDGRPFRAWRDHISSPADIWKEIEAAAAIPGSTRAAPYGPIRIREIMLRSGIRAPMAVKVFGGDLETIDRFGLKLERLLKQVPQIEPSVVTADRIIGKPYLEIDIDRQRIARYGISIRTVQDVIEVAIGGRRITTTVEGRERYPVRVRYMRELRDRIETLGDILVPAPDGRQIPLAGLAVVEYVRGPQMIRSEDTFLVGYVVFDKRPGYSEVEAVEAARDHLRAKIDAGELVVPVGVSYKFAGTYEEHVRTSKRLMIILPLALAVIFLIIYFQFRPTAPSPGTFTVSMLTSTIVFSSVFIAWAGGFLLLWCYRQPWFLDVDVFGANLRELFHVRPYDLTVAVWVGFLALFGIATDDGVIQATLLRQVFRQRKPATIQAVRAATVEAGRRRARACLMTTATTILALLPVLTSTGRGSDIMVPMAIPSFGGMLVALLSLFVVPTLFCAVQEWRLRFANLTSSTSEGVSP